MEIDEFFEKNVKQNMYQDIECMMCHGLNFSVATLLAAYTEIVGAVYQEQIGNTRNLECYYNSMLITMGYGSVITEFQNKYGNNLTPYIVIRCGLIHQYNTKKDANIHSEYDDCKIGIYFNEDLLTICNRKYFEDFKTAVDKIIKCMNEDMEKKNRMNDRFKRNNIDMSSGPYPILA